MKAALFAILTLLSTICSLEAQSLVMAGGNGQVVQEQFATVSPFLVQARSASGSPLANVDVAWTISSGTGTILEASSRTDSEGFARAKYLGTSIQPGTSFTPAMVTANSAVGSVSFVVTTVATRTLSGQPASLPLVELVKPDVRIEGAAGATVPGAVQVRVTAQSGISIGQGIPNVGVRIGPVDDPSNTPYGQCNGPAGIVLTGSDGVATCDLVLNRNVGTAGLGALVGEYQNTRRFTLEIKAGVACSYTLSPVSSNLPASAVTSTVSVTAAQGCAWTASSNASWISITSGTSGSGNGTITYAVSANNGPGRTGTLTIGGQTFTVTQAAVGGTPGTPLTIITSATLPNGAVGNAYSTVLTASGGTMPYTWTLTGSLPPGLTLASNGTISGSPSVAGMYNFTGSVADTAGGTANQAFQLTILAAGGTLAITNTSFPAGVVSTPYQQAITVIGACQSNPFSGPPVVSVASGTLPTGLTLASVAGSPYGIAGIPTAAGPFTFALRVTDSCGGSATSTFTIEITQQPSTLPALSAAPGALAFTVATGATAAPANQQISISSGTSSIPITTTVSTVTGGNWLTIVAPPTAGALSTPATIVVAVGNTSALPAGTYSGSVQITGQASNSPLTVPVTLTVTTPSVLSVSPVALTFQHSSTIGTTVSQQALTISAGGARVPFSAAASTTSGGPWLTVSPERGETTAGIVVIVNSGGLGGGSYTGLVTITPENNPGAVQTVPVSLTVSAPAVLRTSAPSLSFTARQGATPTPQTLGVESTGAPLRFTVTQSTPWLSVSPTAGTTPANITVSANPSGLAPGTYSATLSLLADGVLIPVTIPVGFTIGSSSPQISSVTNAASFQEGAISPGEFLVIFGTDLGPLTLVGSRVIPPGVLDTTLSETRVLFDGIPAPLIYTWNTQVAVIVPYAMAGRVSARVELEYRGVRSNIVELRVVEAAPGLFTSNSAGQAAALNQDTSINGPQNPADAGSIVVLYATGQGQMNPPQEDGRVVEELARPVLPVTVEIGGVEAEVLYAGAAPGIPAGAMQVNARIPASAARGTAVPVLVRVGQRISQTGVTIAIR